MNCIEKYEHWLNSENTDELTKRELSALSGKEDDIKERFYKDIEFGTAGMRGVLGAGTNRMNIYTVRKATQGYAEYIKSMGNLACQRGVVIAHDNRRFSVEFALQTAGVLASNGIRSYLFDSLRPTPELSFAVRYMKAFGGVMITASHNPPEYNGYKLYDERGCQLVPEMTDAVIKHVEAVDDPIAVRALTRDEAGELISTVDAELDEKYYEAVMGIAINPDIKKDIKIVYSPQHGTGNVPVRTVLDRLGYNVIPVLEQCTADPDFSATKNPNPETAAAFELSLDYARRADADIAITTDPDCDRLGVAVRHHGDYVLMTGNQSAAVLLDYILSEKTRKGIMPENPVMFNTVVTSDLGDAVCKAYGVAVEKTLTGFKFIGHKIYGHELLGDKNFVFGYEESYGCLVADFVRDKDAVQASLMLCECAAYYKEKGMTLVDALNSLFDRFGYYHDALDNFMFKGIDGADKIRALVDGLRNNPPSEVDGVEVVDVEDYNTERMMNKGFCKSNVLRFILADGSWVAIRPSGTEPKCKFYFCIRAKNKAESLKKLEACRAVFEKKD